MWVWREGLPIKIERIVEVCEFFSVTSSREMAQTEPQQIPAGQPAQAVAPPAYDSLPADLQKPQQPPPPQQVSVQQLQQGVPFQTWPQGQHPHTVVGGFPQQGPVQYIAVSDRIP